MKYCRFRVTCNQTERGIKLPIPMFKKTDISVHASKAHFKKII